MSEMIDQSSEAKRAYKHSVEIMSDGHCLPPAVLAGCMLIASAIVSAGKLIANAIVRRN